MDATAPAEPPPPPALVVDDVGIFWITLTCVYTTFLSSGLVYLWIHRSHPTIRIRHAGLTIAAVINLHIYWVLCALGYVLGPVFPEMLEFWIMSIYFPIGLALFQAANSRLLSVARGQERCFAGPGAATETTRLTSSVQRDPVTKAKWTSFTTLRERWAGLSETARRGWYITLAIVMQVSHPARCTAMHDRCSSSRPLRSRSTTKILTYLDFIDSPCCFHLLHFTKVPPWVGNFRHGGTW
jgi:hypothetical protein